MKKAKSPVIIIGMHRSGTSMIARLLEAAGLFLGKKKDQNCEALLFLRINDWLLRQSGGSWDNPEPIHRLLENDQIGLLVGTYIRRLLKSFHVCSFTGIRNYLRYRSLENFDIAWGWKDPRNTFTLPFWLEIFPDAKIIHIYRHGVDVSHSLKVRQQNEVISLQKTISRTKLTHLLSPLRPNFLQTVLCQTIEEGFILWEKYLQEANNHMSKLGDRGVHVKYEDFLSKPSVHMKNLASFCGLNIRNTNLANVIKTVDKNSAYKYIKSPELIAFADRKSEILRSRGY